MYFINFVNFQWDLKKHIVYYISISNIFCKLQSGL